MREAEPTAGERVCKTKRNNGERRKEKNDDVRENGDVRGSKNWEKNVAKVVCTHVFVLINECLYLMSFPFPTLTR